MAAFKQMADIIQTADMLQLSVPKANFHTEVSDVLCPYNVPRSVIGEDGEVDSYPARGWYGWLADGWLCIKETAYDETAGLAQGYACNVETGEVRPGFAQWGGLQNLQFCKKAPAAVLAVPELLWYTNTVIIGEV